MSEIAAWKVFLAVVGLLVAIALGASLVRNDTPQPSATQIGPTAVPPAAITPTSVPAAVPSAVPTVATQPTTAASTPTPTPSAETPAAPEPVLVNQAELMHNGLIVGQKLVLNDGSHIWTSHGIGNSPWIPFELPRDLGATACQSALGDHAAFVAHDDDGTQTLVSFDVEDQTWAVAGLPPTPTGVADAAYCRAALFDSRWVLAATDGTTVSLAVSDDDGRSFQHRTVVLPEPFTAQSSWPVSATSVDVYRHDQTIVLDVCTQSIQPERGCPVDLIQLPDSVLDGVPLQATESTIVALATNATNTFPEYMANSRYRPSTMITAGADTVWLAEQVSIPGTHDYESGSEFVKWAANELGRPPVPLPPAGYEHRFFPHRDGLVAEVFITPRPNESSHSPHQSNSEWWAIDANGAEWTRLPEPPVVENHSIRWETPVSLYSATFDRFRTVFLVPRSFQESPWDTDHERFRGDGTYYGDIEVAGETLFAVDAGGSWSSADRGRSWNRVPHRDGAAPETHGDCTAVYDDEFAYTTRHVGAWVNTMAHLVVEDADSGDRLVVEFPDDPTEGDYRTHFNGCRPVRIGDTWIAASIDLPSDRLAVFSSSNGEPIVEHHIDLSGPWREALNPSLYSSWVDLYRDGDWIVATVCAQIDSFACVTTNLVFHRSLIEEGAPPETSAQREHDRAESRFLAPNPHEHGGAELLFQFGDDLWRADAREQVGESDYGEGQILPVHRYTVGRFRGPSQDLPNGWTGEAPPMWGSRPDPGLLFVFNDRVTSCGFTSATLDECYYLEADGWQRHLGSVAVDWDTVPAGTEVTFSHRDDDGNILVIAG